MNPEGERIRKESGAVTSGTARAAPGWWRRWPVWIGYAAAAWSLLYGLLGLWWALGGAGFPFGAGNDPSAELSVLGGARAEVGAPVIAALGLVGALAAVAMGRAWGRGIPRAVLLVFAWTVAAWLALAIPDYRVLVAVAYAPIVLIGAPFGWPPGVSILDVFPWPVVNQFFCIFGGLLWAATTVAYGRRSRSACESCGRDDAGWTTPDSAARWGRWATYVAVVIPVLYAVTRWAWALGFPLGISEELLREGQEVGLWWVGAALATIAVGGAILRSDSSGSGARSFPAGSPSCTAGAFPSGSRSSPPPWSPSW
jgi:hypothetical protein